MVFNVFHSFEITLDRKSWIVPPSYNERFDRSYRDTQEIISMLYGCIREL